MDHYFNRAILDEVSHRPWSVVPHGMHLAVAAIVFDIDDTGDIEGRPAEKLATGVTAARCERAQD
jgi:hypothetical protein